MTVTNERTNERTNGKCVTADESRALMLQVRDDAAMRARTYAQLVESLDAVLGLPPIDRGQLVGASAAAATPKKEPAPPRPSAPAPPTTNGAGLDDKVLHALKAGPLSPMEIRAATGINPLTLPDVTARLTVAKKVQRRGTGRGTTYQLA